MQIKALLRFFVNRILLMFLVCCVTNSRAQAPTVDRVDICDLFADLGKWNGRLIEVRATIESWNGRWVSGRHCPTVIKVGAVKFDNIIALTNPQADKRTRGHSVLYTWDTDSLQAMDEAELSASRSKQRIEATVIGLYETRPDRKDLVDRRFPDQYFGFGDQNVAPAQILLREFKNISLGPGPQKERTN